MTAIFDANNIPSDDPDAAHALRRPEDDRRILLPLDGLRRGLRRRGGSRRGDDRSGGATVRSEWLATTTRASSTAGFAATRRPSRPATPTARRPCSPSSGSRRRSTRASSPTSSRPPTRRRAMPFRRSWPSTERQDRRPAQHRGRPSRSTRTSCRPCPTARSISLPRRAQAARAREVFNFQPRTATSGSGSCRAPAAAPATSTARSWRGAGCTSPHSLASLPAINGGGVSTASTSDR